MSQTGENPIEGAREHPNQRSTLHGIDATQADRMRRLFESTPGIDHVWIYGSQARGDYRSESDIDLVVDAPSLDIKGYLAFVAAFERLPLILRVDLKRWQDISDENFRENIVRDRRVFWAPFKGDTQIADIGSLELKDFQRRSLACLDAYLDELNRERTAASKVAQIAAEQPDLHLDVPDFPKKAWETLTRRGQIPSSFSSISFSSRFDGAGHPIPNVCVKIPTGGGKTLLAAAAVSMLQSKYLREHTGLVLWIVPNEAIYTQTKKALVDRDHPYRQLLSVAGAGRVRILEKDSPLTRLDVDSNLCVMLLMLQSAARQSKETLRFFRDRGSILGFFPLEDDIEGHWSILETVPNLDVYAPTTSGSGAGHNKGSIIKDSLGNVMRIRRPLVVIDEGHHAYTENALKTIDGFNPSFVLELSATPRVARRAGEHGANVLVDVLGTDLERADMIKLPINVDVRPWPDWRSCLTESLVKLNELQVEAAKLEGDSGRYIRPILLVQVERTGADQIDPDFIHARDAELHLLQLGLSRDEIAHKTSEKNDLSQPENIELTSPHCRVRAIITKQALQEGWDCPFAYVLCALAAGRNQAAMTQLVGRILRQPHVAKTGRAPLDECYVYCHDTQTSTVVANIKSSLENEGMGDLTASVRSTGTDAGSGSSVVVPRRPQFEHARIFLPRVTWLAEGSERELEYESDILGNVDWSLLSADEIAASWTLPDDTAIEHRFKLGLDVLGQPSSPSIQIVQAAGLSLDRTFLARAIGDLVPNTWLAYGLVERVLTRLIATNLSEAELARAVPLLVQQFRTDISRLRDHMAEQTFSRLVREGSIRFRLTVESKAYEIPNCLEVALPSQPRQVTRRDGRTVEKSLFSPFYESMVDNDLELQFACYLDNAAAVTWWHRNVAKAQYGLQGWKRNKVYPDFVFLHAIRRGEPMLVILETKGAHLKNEDSEYKQRLFERLNKVFSADIAPIAGQLDLVGSNGNRVVCDLVFDENWENQLNAKLKQQV